MAKYVDGFVIPIKKSQLKNYKKMASLGCKVWMEYGALDYYECVGNDFVKAGSSFPEMCKLKADETAIFAFIVYKSKTHRNQVNKKVMKDPRMNLGDKKMPFDMKRLVVGGFDVMVASEATKAKKKTTKRA